MAKICDRAVERLFYRKLKEWTYEGPFNEWSALPEWGKQNWRDYYQKQKAKSNGKV